MELNITVQANNFKKKSSWFKWLTGRHNLDNRTALAGNLYNLPSTGEILKFRAPEGKEEIINLKCHISVITILLHSQGIGTFYLSSQEKIAFQVKTNHPMV